MEKNKKIVTSVVCEGCEMLSKDCFKDCCQFQSALKVAELKDQDFKQFLTTLKFQSNLGILFGLIEDQISELEYQEYN